MDDSSLIGRFLQHRDTLLAFIFALTRDRDTAEEVFQEVGLAIVAEDRKGTTPDQFLAWAREIARRRVRGYYRQRARQRALFPISDALAEVIDRAFQESEQTGEWDRQRSEFLGRCVAALSGRGREVIEQKYQRGFSVARIAESLGWKPESVKVALSRARKQIAECVERKLRAYEAL